eukprot:6472831-Amphidinium_carterae.1
MDEEYAVIMFIVIYKQARLKKDKPGQENKFVMFMINNHTERTQSIMQRAGCTTKKIEDAYEFYDSNGQQSFNQPNIHYRQDDCDEDFVDG